MCSPEHTHVAIQNSPDNVSIHYVWSTPLNSIPKSFLSLSIHFSFTFYQTVLMLVGVSSVLFVKWVCWWLGRVIMIFHSIFPIDIIVDLCHFEPPNIQYLHDPKMVMRPIIRIVRGNDFNLMPLIPNTIMMRIAGRSVVWDRNNISLQWTSDMCSVYSSWGLVNSGWRVRVVRRCVTFVSFFWPCKALVHKCSLFK